MSDRPGLRAIDGGDAEERAGRERARADAYASKAMDELVAAEFGHASTRERQVHREVARACAEIAGVYAARDLALSNRGLAAAYGAMTDVLRARREAGS